MRSCPIFKSRDNFYSLDLKPFHYRNIAAEGSHSDLSGSILLLAPYLALSMTNTYNKVNLTSTLLPNESERSIGVQLLSSEVIMANIVPKIFINGAGLGYVQHQET